MSVLPWVIGISAVGVVGVGGYLLFQEAQRVERTHKSQKVYVPRGFTITAPSARERKARKRCVAAARRKGRSGAERNRLIRRCDRED